jgi:uncharacterized membrane protein
MTVMDSAIVDMEQRTGQGSQSPSMQRGGMQTQRQMRRRQSQQPSDSSKGQGLAGLLGLFGLGLGLVQVLAPRELLAFIGVRPHDSRVNLVRLVGVRELMSGAGILINQDSKAKNNWVWGRVAGDVMDIAAISAVMNSRGSDQGRLMAVLAAVAGVTAMDVLAGRQLASEQSEMQHTGSVEEVEPLTKRAKQEAGNQVNKAVTINRSAEDLYQFWRNFENLPKFMDHLVSVRNLEGDGKRTHWEAKAPLGKTVEWDAEVIEDVPNRRIAWRSLEGADVYNEGSVTFEPAPGNRGTMIKVEMSYDPPGGKIGATVAKLAGQAPDKQIPLDLRRFKQLLEAGEIASTEGQPAGREKSTSPVFDDFLRK